MEKASRKQTRELAEAFDGPPPNAELADKWVTMTREERAEARQKFGAAPPTGPLDSLPKGDAIQADDLSSLYAALPDAPIDISVVFYDAEGSEIARRVSRGARRFVTLEKRDYGLWPRVRRIVTATLAGKVLRDIRVIHSDLSDSDKAAPSVPALPSSEVD